MLQPAPQ